MTIVHGFPTQNVAKFDPYKYLPRGAKIEDRRKNVIFADLDGDGLKEVILFYPLDEELEALFSGTQPELIRLKIDRGGVPKTIQYKTEKVSEILKQNHARPVNGVLIPAGIADEDVRCFTDECLMI